MYARKAAYACNHWVRNHSPGKEKRRFRQPGYRPEQRVGAAGMRCFVHDFIAFPVAAATPFPALSTIVQLNCAGPFA